jgi:hypothetical protein
MKAKVLAIIHDSPLGGHSGYLKTLQRAMAGLALAWDAKGH